MKSRAANGINAPKRPDCVAGVRGLELRNVDANYLFERSHRFAGIQPNSGFGDYSRLSCRTGDTQLGAGFCRDLQQAFCTDVGHHVASPRRHELAAISFDQKMICRRRAIQQYHCSLCAGLFPPRERLCWHGQRAWPACSSPPPALRGSPWRMPRPIVQIILRDEVSAQSGTSQAEL